MKNKLSATLFGLASAVILPNLAFAGGHDTLPNIPNVLIPNDVKQGQCFAKKLVHATYKKEPHQVIVRDGYKDVETRDAVIEESHKETYTTRDGYTDFEVTEPEFESHSFTVVTRPAYIKLKAVHPRFNKETHTFLIREPRMVWRSGSDLSGVRRLDSATGEILCLVEERGLSQPYVREVVASEARVDIEQIPAKTETITRRVLVQAPKVIKKHIQPETKTVAFEKIVRESQQKDIYVDPQAGTIYKQEIENEDHYVLVPVDCNDPEALNVGTASNARSGELVNKGPEQVKVSPDALRGKVTTTYSISSLQTALAKRNFYRGPIDGITGKLTRDAVAKFQESQGMPVTGIPDGAVAKALGL